MDKEVMKKLKESIPSTGMKIIDLYNKIDNNPHTILYLYITYAEMLFIEQLQ